VIRKDPKNSQVYHYRGLANNARGKFEEASKDFAEEIRVNPKAAADTFELGMEVLKKGDSGFAVACFIAVIRHDAKNAEAYYFRALGYIGMWNYDQAIKDFTETIRLNPKHAQAYVKRGNLFVEKKMYEKAIEDHKKAIELDATYALANIIRGNSYREIKNYRAIEDFSVVFQPKSNRVDPSPYIDRGNAYLDSSEYDKAIEDFDRAIQISQRHALIYVARGRAFQGKKSFDRAIQDYSEAIRLDPNNPEAYHKRSQVYRAKGDLTKARADKAKFWELWRSDVWHLWDQDFWEYFDSDDFK
jgi:tetratricopeptide (TPR) repeat protein